MKIIDHLNLFFNKKKLVKITIYTEDRRQKTTVRKLVDGMVSVDGKDYMVKSTLITLDGTVPVLCYKEDNPTPFDMLEGNVKEIYTADNINKVLNNKVFSNMITNLKKKDDLINKLVVMMGILVLIFIGGLYFIYDQNTVIQELLQGREALMEALKQALLNGDIGQ